MSGNTRKILLLVMAGILLFVSSRIQNSMNVDREKLNLTRIEPLKNAPPVLAFTTVALGGFRGLISNALWMRASDLQDEDKFFEMAQLADWITKLEPSFVQVWLVQSWNMAYNISVKFKDFPDRWRWVSKGIELLRDDGLHYNPNEVLIYRELAWFFQHKMGQNLDDANMYYKQAWANEMANVFAKKKPNLDELIHPKTADEQQRRDLLITKYKMDPEFMKQVDQRYGPLEWRLPEAHAIYWAAQGLKKAAEHPEKVKQDDLITLRRVIYQSMQLSFQRGRLITNPLVKAFEFGPNIDIIPKVSAAYEQAADEDKANHDHILRAHRNFLRDAIYFLYEHNRIADAAKWYKYIGLKYPDKTMLDGKTNSFPANLSLDEYVVTRVAEDINETDKSRITSAIEGYLANSYINLIQDEEERAAGMKVLARKIWETYMSKISKERVEAIGLQPFEDIDSEVRRRLLDPAGETTFEFRALLRTKLGLPADPNDVNRPEAVPGNGPSTNKPPATISAGQ
jgi:hypothetical protein